MKKPRSRMIHYLWLAAARLLLACLCTVISVQAFPQKISTILSKDKIVIGEQVLLRIKVEGVSPGEIQQDFIFPDTINHIEIVSDSIESTGSLHIHNLTITSFDSGSWQIPSFHLSLSGNRRLETVPLTLTVLPVDVSDMVDFHDIKDILEVPAENNWWLVAAVVALALVSLFGFLWFVSRKQQTQQTFIPEANLQQVYQKTLSGIREAASADRSTREGAVKTYGNLASITRHFTDVAYGQKTAHLTSGEYMTRVNGKLPDTDTEKKYFQFLRLTDAVKFAKYHPPVEETADLFAQLEQMVTSVYNQTKTAG